MAKCVHLNACFTVAQLTADAPLLEEFYNDNPKEINEMRIMLRFTALALRVLLSASQPV